MNRIFLTAAALLFLTACQTIVIDFENGPAPEQPQQKQAQVSMWLGIQEFSDPMQVTCPRGPAKIVIKRSPLDFLIHFAIGGVYTRISAAAYCPQ